MSGLVSCDTETPSWSSLRPGSSLHQMVTSGIRHRVVWALLPGLRQIQKVLTPLDMRNWLPRFCFVCIDWTVFGVWWCCDCESYFTAWPEMGVDKLTRILMLACVIKSILLTTFKCVRNYSSLTLALLPRHLPLVTGYCGECGAQSYEWSLCRILQFQGQLGATHRALIWVDEASNWRRLFTPSPCGPLPQLSKVCHEAIVRCQWPPGVTAPDHFTRLRRCHQSCLGSLLPPLPEPGLLVLQTILCCHLPCPAAGIIQLYSLGMKAAILIIYYI